MRRKTIALEPDAYLARGGRKVEAWCASVCCVEVDIEDEVEAMRNINTPEDLAALGGHTRAGRP